MFMTSWLSEMFDPVLPLHNRRFRPTIQQQPFDIVLMWITLIFHNKTKGNTKVPKSRAGLPRTTLLNQRIQGRAFLNQKQRQNVVKTSGLTTFTVDSSYVIMKIANVTIDKSYVIMRIENVNVDRSYVITGI